MFRHNFQKSFTRNGNEKMEACVMTVSVGYTGTQYTRHGMT